MVTLAVVGSREGIPKELVFKTLDNFYKKLGRAFTIVTVGARGVDSYAEEWVKKSDLDIGCLKIVPPINPASKVSYLYRNIEILTMANAIYAFWNGTSTGTKFVIDYAKKRGKTIKVIRPENSCPNKCPKCNGTDFENLITIPERTSDTIIAVCKSCNRDIRYGDWHGKSIHDR